MSVNDPILEALSFTLENDLNILTPPQASSSSPSSSLLNSSSNPSGSMSHLSNCQASSSSGDDKHCDSSKMSTTNDATGGSSDFVKSSILLGEEERTMCPFSKCSYFTEENISSGDKKAQGEFLSHLLVNHHLVIDNCDEIANLSKYFQYWKGRFATAALTEFCVGFAMEEPPKPPEGRKRKKQGGRDDDSSANVENVQEVSKKTTGSEDNLYFMLSPALPEDSKLRKHLWKQRLNTILEVNRQEREDVHFCRRCLFCRDSISGNRSKYFVHMRDNHSFHIGQPDNLVFVKELLQFIEDKLNRLECLFCEHVFKDKVVLKEHMRKKQHRKINPKNSEYDRFYIVNYLEPGKTWETIELEDAEDERKEDEWLEAPEEKERNVVCLFCKTTNSDFPMILEHMKTEHLFDFTAVSSNLDFYQKVKLINYIRRTVYQNICLSCEQHFTNLPQLLKHISEHQINGRVELLPKTEEWNQPEYFFPTYEEDDFLTCLDSDDVAVQCDISSEDESNVIPEDLPHIDIKDREFDLAGFAIRYHNQNNS